MHSNPLETYFGKHPERRPKTEGTNSSLWRGYIATFEIVDRQFKVRDVTIEVYDEKATYGRRLVSKMDHAFPKGTSKALTWFTGFLILPQGKQVSYVHMGYASTYERYRLLFVKAGQVTADRIFTHDEYQEYKVKQFEAFTHTERYRQMQKSISAQGGDVGFNSEHFLYIIDTDFPVETLIDYKDFRPNSAQGPAAKK